MVHSANTMSKVLNGNGNGLHSQLVRQIKKKAAQAAVPPHAVQESQVTFKTADGVQLHGTPVRVTRHMAVFELYNPNVTLQFSEALDEFDITLQAQKVYSGRATICNVVNAGTKTICEATLKDDGWTDLNLDLVVLNDERLAEEFKKFVQEWQKIYKVLPEYKEAVVDITMFLTDLQFWLEQINLGIRSSPKQPEMEQSVIKRLSPPIISSLNILFSKFEHIAAGLSEEMRPAHRSYIQRLLHPLVLAAPFANRAYRKPLGYAGDYEMVNMMARNLPEGASLFAKIFHVWLVDQGSALAHRNRLKYLARRIEEETMRVSNRSHRDARIYSFACGPAIEVQHFIEDSPLSERAEFTLVDFETHALECAAKTINQTIRKRGLDTLVRFKRKSVQQLIKESQKTNAAENIDREKYDFVYCAGLFDYLPDSTCRLLMKIFYDWLAPGGLLLLTNVAPTTPNRGSMELILDWHLIYRDAAQFLALSDAILEGEPRVQSDETGINIFLEARKPISG